MSFQDLLDELQRGLATLPADSIDAPVTARRGAVLLLLEPTDDEGGARILYTRRQAHLSSHPGQISFPGGRVDPGESVVGAALREADEEVGLEPSSVEVVGRLPAFYIPPSRFWMSAVVGVWRDPHPLRAAEDEVAEILHVDIFSLREEERWRAVPLSAAGSTWAWQLNDGDLLWGATAVVTSVLLDLALPGWSDGHRPNDLAADRVVRPWETVPVPGAPAPRPRLGDIASRQVITPTTPRGASEEIPPTEEDRRAWASGVAEGVQRLLVQLEGRAGPVAVDGPVVVLCGPGNVGAVGRAAAEILRTGGEDVVVVEAADGIDGLDGDTLIGASVIVDAMVGRGLRGLLADPLLGLVRALRDVSAPIVAVDLPSGIDPERGMVGETVSADVTITAPLLVPGHVAGGAMPFVADLYVVDRDGLRRAEVVDRPAEWGE